MPETKSKEPGFVQDQRPVKRSRADRYDVFYANNTEVGVSPWDMRFKFAQLMGGDETNIFLEDQCDVVLSLQHAKALGIIIRQHINSYEAAYGKLAIPTREATQPEGTEAAQPTRPAKEAGERKTK